MRYGCCAALPTKLLRSACRSLVWADELDRTDAVEGSLRQVYAELGGMIGGSHKAERCMLSTRSAGMVGTVDMGIEIAAQLTVLGEIPRERPVRRNWRERRRKAGRVREQTAQFARRKSSGCGLSGGRCPLAPRTHPSIRRRS